MDAKATTSTSSQQPSLTPQPIESASASTRDQTNGSSFAYTLTATVLGVLALIGIALGLLLYSVAIQTARTSAVTNDISSMMRQNDIASGAVGTDGARISIL